MKVSFCTTCCNRLHQFVQTLDKNYDLIKNNPNTEWVIVNYNSSDDTHKFILEKLKHMSNRVIYVNEFSGRKWHASIAKNVAHKNATGDVLMNLDCDNYIGDSLYIILEKFSNDMECMQMWTGVPYDGTYGRIAINKDLFFGLGGYDETFYPMGGQDSDLLNRAKAFGAKCERYVSDKFVAIPNTKEDSIKNAENYGLSWQQMARKNRKVMQENLSNNNYIANTKNGMMQSVVEVFYGELN